jgi:hypothetical protein
LTFAVPADVKVAYGLRNFVAPPGATRVLVFKRRGCHPDLFGERPVPMS